MRQAGALRPAHHRRAALEDPERVRGRGRDRVPGGRLVVPDPRREGAQLQPAGPHPGAGCLRGQRAPAHPQLQWRRRRRRRRRRPRRRDEPAPRPLARPRAPARPWPRVRRCAGQRCWSEGRARPGAGERTGRRGPFCGVSLTEPEAWSRGGLGWYLDCELLRTLASGLVILTFERGTSQRCILD